MRLSSSWRGCCMGVGVTKDRFNAGRTTIWDFGDEFLVVCPACEKMACVKSDPKNSKNLINLSCLNCGHSKKLHADQSSYSFGAGAHAEKCTQGKVVIGGPYDWYFHYPLWLQQSCCGHILWAQNQEHLEWLKQYISAKIRIQGKDILWGYSNQSLASRLPKWVQSASNRPKLIKTIVKLEGML